MEGFPIMDKPIAVRRVVKGVDNFFNDVAIHPNDWTPLTFANYASTTSWKDYGKSIDNLRRSNTCLRAFAAQCYEWLIDPSNGEKLASQKVHFATNSSNLQDSLNMKASKKTFQDASTVFYDLKNPFLDKSKPASSTKVTPTEVRTGKRGRMNSIGQFADGVTIWEGSQLCLSETSSIHNAKADKLRQDQFKLARAMRDSWISQVKTISKHSIPRRGIAVYGSSTYNDETSFWRLDFCGVFRLLHFDSFFVPLKKSEFGKNAKEAILRSLILAIRIKAEVSAREEEAKSVDHEERELLREIVNSIQPTTSTPTKNHKKRPAPFSRE
ncbi:hypothetical protein BGZ65_007026 [Modicella reniformis]|uniref:Uncharacterized protein n=1 Tax=Modicella reniformis TaxID=1440133 RepID=A0A9P6IVS0_9FUNG|nr:hypothetical protein BGZ65_007026 [Modicella reniformis]